MVFEFDLTCFREIVLLILNIRLTLDWLAIDDSHVFHISRELDEHMVVGEVLYDALEGVIQLQASYPLPTQLVLDVQNFFELCPRFIDSFRCLLIHLLLIFERHGKLFLKLLIVIYGIR